MSDLTQSYEKLNELLDECFWSESRYINASEEIDERSLGRFLKQESVLRNTIGNKIAQLMLQEGKNPSRLDVIVGASNRDWQEVKASFPNSKMKHILRACLEQDQVLLQYLKDLIDGSQLPVRFLEVLVTAEFQIEKSHEKLKKIREKVKKKTQKIEGKKQ